MNINFAKITGWFFNEETGTTNSPGAFLPISRFQAGKKGPKGLPSAVKHSQALKMHKIHKIHSHHGHPLPASMESCSKIKNVPLCSVVWAYVVWERYENGPVKKGGASPLTSVSELAPPCSAVLRADQRPNS